MLQICERCLNNACRSEHKVVQDIHCNLCGQIKDCVQCEHRTGILTPFIPLITMELDHKGKVVSNALLHYCHGHGKEAVPVNAREHYVWLWQRRRRLRDRDDMAYHFEIEALQDEMDDLWWNLPLEDKDAIRADRKGTYDETA